VIPQLFASDFDQTTQIRLRHLRGGPFDPAVAAVLDWPRFVEGIGGLEIAFGDDDPTRPAQEVRHVVPASRSAVLEKFGTKPDFASRLWRSIFAPNLSVRPIPDIGTPEFDALHDEGRVQRPVTMEHAAGANRLRRAIGGMHAIGLARTIGRRNAAPPRPFVPGGCRGSEGSTSRPAAGKRAC
jgi:hypothetical protein